MVKILISGANGRMGKKVFEAATLNDKVTPVCGVDLVFGGAADFPIYDCFDKVDKEGCILPDKYCEIVGLDTPIAFAISVFVFPDCSISSFKFLLIIWSKFISITLLY